MQHRLISLWQKSPAKSRLWFSVIGSGLIYLAFTLPFLLTRYYHVSPPVDYAKLTQHSAWGFGAYLLGISALFGLYVAGLRTLVGIEEVPEKKALRFVLVSGAAFGLILLFSYPQTAIDILVYALRSRGWALYDLSPFATTLEAFPLSDPWLGLAGEWADAASPYGPVWEWLSLAAYYLSAGDYLLHLLLLKSINLLTYLGIAWLVYQILQIFRPRWALIGAAFFAWNPLVLLESIQNGHNDILMVFFLLLAVWAYARLVTAAQPDRWFLLVFIGAFALSILVKFVTVLVLPFFLLGLVWPQKTWMKRVGVTGIYALAILLIVIIVMAPYWPGLDNWAVMDAGRGAGRSVFALLVLTLLPRVSTATAFDITSTLLYIIFGGIYLWGIWRVISAYQKNGGLPAKAHETPVLVSFYIFFWYILLVATVFHAWYLLWFMPLAALLIPERRVISGATVFSLAALLIIPYYETIRVMIPFLNQNHWWGHLLGVSLLLIPVLLSLWKPIRLLPIDSPSKSRLQRG